MPGRKTACHATGSACELSVALLLLPGCELCFGTEQLDVHGLRAGAAHIAATIGGLKRETGGRLLVEALVPDFQGDLAAVRTIAQSGLDVYAHNVETVRLLSPSPEPKSNPDSDANYNFGPSPLR